MRIRFNFKVLAIIAIFLVGTGIGVGSVFFKEKFFPAGDPAAAVQAQEKKADELGPLLDLGEFIINLKGGGILKTEITIEGVNAKSLEKLQAKQVFLRDRVLTVFAAKEMKDIIAVQEREILRKELIQALNLVTEGEIKDLLFKNYVYSF